MMRSPRQAAGRCLAIVLLLWVAPAPAAGEQVLPAAGARWETAHVQRATARGRVSLRVEIAATPDAHARGLMGRKQLAPDVGMLFIYPQVQSPETGFWMYRTHIALDIAFLDAGGRILAVLGMQPCASHMGWRCPRYRPGVAYAAALEVNQGFFARHRIGVGDHVVLPAGLLMPDAKP